MSSIARAFTMRRKRTDSGVGDSSDFPSPPSPTRSASMRYSKKSVDIKKISGPVQLLSTTNMLTYNAPDVAVIQAQRKASASVSSASSRASVDGSDASSTTSRSRDTHLTDASSVGSISPITSPMEKKPAYFEATPAVKGSSTLRRSISTLEVRQKSLAEENLFITDDSLHSESPAIPQRHPSHSKKAHAELAKKRSIQAMSVSSTSSVSRAHSVTGARSASRERNSLDFFNGRIAADSEALNPNPQPHPFGKELEQLDEVAEEFNVVVSDAEREHDLLAMEQCGLMRFCAADYIAEIQPLFSRYVHTQLSAPTVAWI
ncbi:uncharacterized protein PV09_07509 [Verruconis gallopava]|uniref:Uncharacterized protein n=1 Tax=Verruconis gallopava TaxID=253628 RepID=A0A0D2APE2_9PEZI|nr:uncharacterized protein PV09_07509 [Verruconis gallopava]KIW00989.1 hypothetical protein PV09_07509 [Verruconis gallopava]